MQIEVAYAKQEVQVVIGLVLAEDATVESAIEESGILQRFTEIDLTQNKVGIFGKICKLNQALKPGDRVEIYRPLVADPKESRRSRAANR